MLAVGLRRNRLTQRGFAQTEDEEVAKFNRTQNSSAEAQLNSGLAGSFVPADLMRQLVVLPVV